MNRIILVITLTVSALNSKAQFTKGSLAITGNVGFSSQKVEADSDDLKRSAYSFSPEFLYFTSDKVAIGLGVSISGTKEKPSDNKTSLATFGPLARFQGKLADKTTGFAQVNMNIGSGFSESEASYIVYNSPLITEVQYTKKEKFSLFSLVITPGLNYQIKKHFFLDFRYGFLGYAATNTKPDDTLDEDVKDYKSSEFEIKMDLSTLKLGALFVF
jgi:Outer membrane protein beta-barrel domain